MKASTARMLASSVMGFVVALALQRGASLAQQGRGGGLQFTEPAPIDFTDHQGYVSIFDGRTLDGWDGNPKFWRVEDGAIVGESTPERPSGNSYIVYRRMEAKDFTLKFEIKVEGPGGSGFQYRSRTGLPWLASIPPAVTAFNGPVNLDWMQTGPQADFWPVASSPASSTLRTRQCVSSRGEDRSSRDSANAASG